jgi:hypothetical protein
MADYVATLKNDLVEQFRGKANIEALMEVIGAQLQQVYDFYDQLRQDRGVHTAVGKQLDGVGDIVVMTRMEAGKLAGDPIPFEVIDDETYRRYLIYKILKNTCDCTYPDIIKAFRMFWDWPLYYKEDPAEPATMIFDTGEMDGTVDTTPLFTTPLLRAAGVTLKLYARTKTEMETAKLYILSGLGFAVTETLLPILERDIDYRAHVYVRGGYSTIAEDTLPGVERDYKFGFKLHLGAGLQAVLESTLPNQEREVSYDTSVCAGSAVQSVMETRITDMVMKSGKMASPQRSAAKRTKLQNLRAVADRLKRESTAEGRSAPKAESNKTIEGGTQK